MSVKRNLNLGSSQARAKKRRLFWVRFSIITFFLLVIVFGLAIASGHDKLVIKTFLISGNNSVSTDDILATANSTTADRYIGLFARRNFLIFPMSGLKRNILEQFKTIKEVDVSWRGWQTVAITVVERKPHSVWCGDDPKAVNPVCYFVDKDGFVFDQAPIFSGNLFVRTYGKIDDSFYHEIFALIDILADAGIEVGEIYFDGFDFHFTLTSGPEIIFNDKEGGFDVAFENLFKAIDSDNLDLVKDSQSIKYIDLRFDSKIVIGKVDK
jgi:hypothetical protein